MNIYRKAMLNSYWPPIALFFILPAIVVLLATPIRAIEMVIIVSPFIISILGLGYLLAPIFGPKVATNKAWSFLMAFLCMVSGVSIYLAVAAFSDLKLMSIYFPTYLLAVGLGVFPAMVGAILFIGACEKCSA